jgi:hypothetical protein
MKNFKLLTLGVFLGIAVLAVPFTALAQDIEPEETEWDYGNVELGGSQSHVFTFWSIVGPVFFTGAILAGGGASGYVVTDAPPPTEYSIGEFFEIVVSFEPTELGPHPAILQVHSNASDSPDEVLLYGEGVEAGPGAGGLMADLIDFFDASVDAGTLVGTGSNERVQANRLRAFGHMLDSANDLIELGEDALACEQLWSAYIKADGQHPPSVDFVVGDAQSDLAVMIDDVMTALNCP